MGVFARIRRFFSIKFNKALKSGENPIEVLEYELKKSKQRLQELEDRTSSIRADKKVAAAKREEIIVKRNKAQKVLDTAVAQDDEQLGNEAIALIETHNGKVEAYDKNQEYFEQVISKLDEQYESLKSKYDEKMTKFETLKVQSELSTNMNKINEEIRRNYSSDEFDFSGIEAIEQEIQKAVHYEADRNERIAPKESLEDKIERTSGVNKFQQYKQELEQKQEVGE